MGANMLMTSGKLTQPLHEFEVVAALLDLDLCQVTRSETVCQVSFVSRLHASRHGPDIFSAPQPMFSPCGLAIIVDGFMHPTCACTMYFHAMYNSVQSDILDVANDANRMSMVFSRGASPRFFWQDTLFPLGH